MLVCKLTRQLGARKADAKAARHHRPGAVAGVPASTVLPFTGTLLRIGFGADWRGCLGMGATKQLWPDGLLVLLFSLCAGLSGQLVARSSGAIFADAVDHCRCGVGVAGQLAAAYGCVGVDSLPAQRPTDFRSGCALAGLVGSGAGAGRWCQFLAFNSAVGLGGGYFCLFFWSGFGRAF